MARIFLSKCSFLNTGCHLLSWRKETWFTLQNPKICKCTRTKLHALFHTCTHTYPLHIPLSVHVNCWFLNIQSYSQQYLLNSPWKNCKTIQAHSNLISLPKIQVTKKHKENRKHCLYASWWTIRNIYHVCSMYYNCPFSIKRLCIARLNWLWFLSSWSIWKLSPNRTETAIWSFQNAKYDLEAWLQQCHTPVRPCA